MPPRRVSAALTQRSTSASAKSMTATSVKPSTRAGRALILPGVPKGRQMTVSSIDGFVDRLAAVETGPGCNNFFDHTVPGNAQRRRNLELYLGEMQDRAPNVLLLGEAPG